MCYDPLLGSDGIFDFFSEDLKYVKRKTNVTGLNCNFFLLVLVLNLDNYVIVFFYSYLQRDIRKKIYIKKKVNVDFVIRDEFFILNAMSN